MFDQKLRLDIRIVKFQDYIRRKPESPFGYYGLGVQYLLAGKPAMADRMFISALKINPSYMPAHMGKLEYLLAEKKFLAAARYFHRNRDSFEKKKIYMNRIHRITSRLYLARGFYRHAKSIRSMFVFRDGVGILQRMFASCPENPIVNLLLGMYMLKEGREDERALEIYNLCASMEEIDDKLRWDMIQALSLKNPDILNNENIAGMFYTIPEGAYGKDYANFLITRFIHQRNREKVVKAFSDLVKKHALPDKKTLWQYLLFCYEENIWNSMLAVCCQKLITGGWIDRFVASVANELVQRSLMDNTAETDKILALYGYIQ